jgi:hypothetical protein
MQSDCLIICTLGLYDVSCIEHYIDNAALNKRARNVCILSNLVRPLRWTIHAAIEGSTITYNAMLVIFKC